MARQKAKRKLVERPGLLAAAAALGCNYSHLRRVVIGDRKSKSLMAAYRTLKNSDAKKFTPPAPPKTRVEMPVDWAALQNLSPEFMAIVQKLGYEIVLVGLQVSASPTPHPTTETPADLDEALKAAKAGQFDASSFPLGWHLHYFHVRRAKLGVAIAALKSALDRQGFLPIASILHVEAPGQLMQWFGAEAATLINTHADTDA